MSAVLNQRISFYVASFAGAVLAGLGDLMRGGTSPSVTVVRMGEALRQILPSAFGAGWFALLLLGVIGCVLSFVYTPKSRKESFVLGMSVFAFLTATSPYQQVPNGQTLPGAKPQTTVSLSLVSDAYAQGTSTAPTVDYYIELKAPDASSAKRSIVLSLYDQDASQLLARQNVVTGAITRFSMPKGDYVLYLECQGCARVRVDLNFGKPVEATVIQLPGSAVPVSLQRLYSASRLDARDLQGAQVQEVVDRFRQQ